MDIHYLRTHLKEEYTYQDAPKNIFLDEIEAIFNSHTYSGDTELMLFQGSCTNNFCDNCGQKGYRFVGNRSRNYFDLIFEIEGDDIKDLLSCSGFETEEKVEDLEVCADIHINEDDLVTFVKTPEYLNKLTQALDAFNELITTPIRVLSIQDCTYWVKRHTFLYEAIDGDNLFAPQMKWSKFGTLYSEVKAWCDFVFTDLEVIKRANIELKHTKGEEEILEWIIQFEGLFERVPYNFRFSLKKEGDFYTIDLSDQFLLKGEEFDETFEFIEKYFEHQDDLLKKYSAFTSEELGEIFNKYESEDDINFSSLKFHLDRRAEAKALGMEIPLYLNKIKRD